MGAERAKGRLPPHKSKIPDGCNFVRDVYAGKRPAVVKSPHPTAVPFDPSDASALTVSVSASSSSSAFNKPPLISVLLFVPP
jgi:hypothetical protein